VRSSSRLRRLWNPAIAAAVAAARGGRTNTYRRQPRLHANWTCRKRWHGNEPRTVISAMQRPGDPCNPVRLPLLSGETAVQCTRNLRLTYAKCCERIICDDARVGRVNRTLLQRAKCLSNSMNSMGGGRKYAKREQTKPFHLLHSLPPNK